MADDFIPSNDAEFDKFQAQFTSAVTPDPDRYGLLPQDVTTLKSDQDAWAKAWPAHEAAQDNARTATKVKDGVREKYVTTLRGAAAKVHATAGADNALRVSAGLPARDPVRSSIGAPTTRPLGRIETKTRGTVVLHFVDEQTPQRIAKPQGVHGCQIWAYVGDKAPLDASGYTFLALDTRTPYTDDHDAADAGKTAFYLLRWQNAKGEPGPWSAVVTATIPL